MNHTQVNQDAAAVGVAGMEDIAGLGKRVCHLLHDESGQDVMEYALVAALVGLGVLAALRGLKNSIGGAYNSVGNNLTSSVS